MVSLPRVLSLVHLVGLALGVGCATAKLLLLVRCRSDNSFVLTYIAVSRPITRLIIFGLILLTLSGIGWLLLGYPLTPVLVAKLVLVGGIWVLGPVIDNVVEPRFRRLAPQVGEPATGAFIQVRQRYLLLEVVATGLFYLVIGIWVLI